MNYDGGNRRDVNGKANAGLTLGIIGTAPCGCLPCGFTQPASGTPAQ